MNIVELITRPKQSTKYVQSVDGAIHSKEFVKNCDNYHESYRDYSKNLATED